MKKLILLTLCLLPIFFGCSDSDNTELPDKVIHKSFSGWIGDTHSLYFEELAHDKLEIDNLEIATAYFTELNFLKVQTKAEGRVTVTISNNDKIIAIVHVTSHYFEHAELEEATNSKTLLPDIVVETPNAEIKKIIEEEIWADLLIRQQSIYTFDAKTWTFTIDIVKLGKKYEGTYEWKHNSLILKYNNITETYGFREETYGSRHFVLPADRTNEYQLKYPDAGITRVTYNRVLCDWSYILVGGIIMD